MIEEEKPEDTPEDCWACCARNACNDSNVRDTDECYFVRKKYMEEP